MSTNLEGKSFENKLSKRVGKVERNIDIVEKKFNDAFQRIDNLKRNISQSIEESNALDTADETIERMNDIETLNTELKDQFISNSIGFSDIESLADKYSDNTFRLATLASNNFDMPEADVFLDNETDTYETDSNSSRLVYNDSFNELTGANSLTEERSLGVTSSPGYNRSLFLNIFNSLENITHINDLKEQLPFSKESNPVRNTDLKPDLSVPFIVIERMNKIHSFDFGIEYITKSDTVKIYTDENDTPTVVEVGKHTNSGAFIKRFYGSFIIEDLGDSLKTSYILNNSEKSLFNGDMPEFKFRFSYDDDHIFIYLEDVKPYRITYSNIENVNEPDFYNSENNLSQVFLRDILELMVNNNDEMTNDDIILAIKNKYGTSKEIFGENVGDTTRSILNILTPFRDDPTAIKNIYFIPNYMVNLSIKDNSFFLKDSFIVGQMFERNDILNLPYTIMDIIPNGDTQVQLNGIPFTDGNKTPLVRESEILDITNTIFSSEAGKFIKDKSVSELIEINDNFIKNHHIDDTPIFYHSRILLSTTLNDGNQVDTDKVPDYVIDEIGKYDDDCFYCRYFVTHKDMNESISFSNAKELRDFVNGLSVSFKQFLQFTDGGIENEERSNAMGINGSNLKGSAYKKSIPLLSTPFGFNIDESSFKGLVHINTKILSDEYDFDNLTIKHVSIADDEYKYGSIPSQYDSDIDLPKQAIMIGDIKNVYEITVTDYENCSVYPGNTKVVSGSNIEYIIQPMIGYIIDTVYVDGVEKELVDNKLYIKNVRKDLEIEIQTSAQPKNMYQVTINSSVNCSRIDVFNGNMNNVEEGSYLSFNVVPLNINYRLVNVLANEEPIPFVKNSFILPNIQSDISLDIVCDVVENIDIYEISIGSGLDCDLTCDNYDPNLNPEGVTDSVAVAEYSSLSFKATPISSSHRITKFIINGNQEIVTNGEMGDQVQIISNITDDMSITAEAELVTHEITLIESENCSVDQFESVGSSLSVNYGENLELTFTPDVNHEIDSLLINDNEVTPIGNTYTLINISEDIEIKVRYKIKYNLTVDSGTYCKYDVFQDDNQLADDITSGGPYYFKSGTDNIRVVTIPDEGYEVEYSWILVPDDTNGGYKWEQTSYGQSEYIFNDISNDIGWYSECKLKTYSVTLVQPNNGSIQYNGSTPESVIVDYGSDLTLDIIPDTNYEINQLIINGNSVDIPKSGGQYTINNITESITVEADIVSSNVLVYDNVTYDTVIIGNKEWTVQNLRTTKFNDGTDITRLQDYTDWTQTDEPAYSISPESNYPEDGGYYYNGYAALSDKIAPEGWRVATNDDLLELFEYLENNGYTTDSSIPKALASKDHWRSSTDDNTPGNDPESNNASGLNILPTGWRNEEGGYQGIDYDEMAFLWTSTQTSQSESVMYGLWFYRSVMSHRYDWNKNNGCCIRLVKDLPETSLLYNGDRYDIVKIGNQEWTVQSLKTTKYNDGTDIPEWDPDSDEGGYTMYHPDFVERDGLLYNWYALDRIAPDGWRVPTNEDFENLIQYLSDNGYACDGVGGLRVAKALASNFGWDESDHSDTPGYEQNTTNNSTRFTAFPSAFVRDNGVAERRGEFFTVWTHTEDPENSDNAFYRDIYYDHHPYADGTGELRITSRTKNYAFSVRLVRDI